MLDSWEILEEAQKNRFHAIHECSDQRRPNNENQQEEPGRRYVARSLEWILQQLRKHNPCMYVCMHIHTYVQTYMHVSLCVHTYIQAYLPTCLPAYLHTYIPAYLHAHMPTYLHTYIRTHLPACLPACQPVYLPPAYVRVMEQGN